MSTEKVTAHVKRITVGDSAFVGVYPPNVYLVAGDGKAVFIDTAYGKDEEVEAQLEAWESLGKPTVEGIVLTHRHGDHIGGAVRLSEATGGPIISSACERAAIDADLKGGRVARAVRSGETMGLGDATLEFIETPGHTLGSLCIYLREDDVLFSGDMILGTGTTVISPEHGDMRLYIESLRKLLDYDAAIIAPGHGPEISEANAKIQSLIDHRLDREAQILRLIDEGKQTIEALFEAIYPELHPGLHDVARSQIRAHLVKLEQDRKVQVFDAHISTGG